MPYHNILYYDMAVSQSKVPPPLLKAHQEVLWIIISMYYCHYDLEHRPREFRYVCVYIYIYDTKYPIVVSIIYIYICVYIYIYIILIISYYDYYDYDYGYDY